MSSWRHISRRGPEAGSAVRDHEVGKRGRGKQTKPSATTRRGRCRTCGCGPSGPRGSGARSSGAAGRRSAPASRCAPTRRGRAARRPRAARPASSRRVVPSMRRGAAALAWPVGWQFWFSGPAVALRADALPTGRIDGPEESCGRIDGPGCGAAPLCRRFAMQIIVMLASASSYRAHSEQERTIHRTSTAYRLRRRMSRTKSRGLGRAVAVPSRAALRVTAHPRTPELISHPPIYC